MSTQQSTDATNTDATPAKYRATQRTYEDKDWCYEQYWGEMRSLTDMAEECGVTYDTIKRQMDEFGIPRRRSSCQAGPGEYDPREDFALSEKDDQPNWNRTTGERKA
jgi:hypothetical protein